MNSSFLPLSAPLRILHVLDESIPLHSGYVFRTLAILREQRRLGWKTFHITGPKQGAVNTLRECVDGLQFERTPPATGMLARTPVIRHSSVITALHRRLNDVVEAVRPHVIHVHSPVLNVIPALLVARRFNVPVVYEIRAFWEDAAVNRGTTRAGGIRYHMTRALESWAVKKADAVVTICAGLRDDLLKRGVSTDRITVVPNAVDTETFTPASAPDQALQETLGLQSGTTLGFAGSFYEYEGLEVLLQAMPAVLRAVPAARLLLLGGERQQSGLRELSAQLGVEQAVKFIGRVPHGEIQRYYSVMDVMVYPRTSCRLTELVTPLKPLEAMALGKPVVASDVGGHRELIRDGHNGLLFKAGSVQALAWCLTNLLKQSELRQDIAKRAREYVECERNWAGSVARYKWVYSDAVDRWKQYAGQQSTWIAK